MKKSATKGEYGHPAKRTVWLIQEQLAVYLGISRSHLSLYKMGERMLPAEATDKWLDAV